MTGITIDLGTDGLVDLRIDDKGKFVDLTSAIPRDVCADCGNQLCCNTDHGMEPDPANADDLGHHECVDRLLYNGALHGIEAMALAVVSELGEVPPWLKSVIITALEAARNNIYG